jgi:hypothetical protein
MAAPEFARGRFSGARNVVRAVADAGKREKELERLKAKRARLVDAFTDGLIDKADFAARVTAMDQSIREAEALLPAAAPPPLPEVRRVLAGLRIFAPSRFSKLPFETRRSHLRRVVREIRVEDGAIPEFTVSGAFSQEFTNTNSNHTMGRRHKFVCPDLRLALPEPLIIPRI